MTCKQIPSELFIKAAKAGILGAVVGFGGEEKYMPYPLPAGVPLEEWDAFHSVIVTDELSRCGSGGVCISTHNLRSKLSICFLGSLGFMRWFRYVFSVIYH